MLGALIKHEMKWRRNPKSKPKSWKWHLAYLIPIFIVAIYILTDAGLDRQLKPHQLWYYLYGFPFLVIAMAYSLTNQEWQYQTFGWWLSLPYSRLRLVTAKFWASLLKSFLIIFLAMFLNFLFYLYVMLLQAEFSIQALQSYMLIGGKALAYLIGFSPFLASLGMLMAILMRTNLKTTMVFMWIVLWMVCTILAGYLLKFIKSLGLAFSLSPFLLVLMAVSWLLTCFILFWMSYLLERKLAL